MKKAQLLSAIALAFALGVVAPVASTVSAYTPEVKNDKGVVTTAGSATEADVENAVAALKAKYPAYENYMALYDLIVATDNDTATFDYNTDVDPVKTALDNLGLSADTAKVVTTGRSNSAILDDFVALTSKVDDFGLVAAVIRAYDAKDDVAYHNALVAYHNAYPNADIHYGSDRTVNNKVAETTAELTAVTPNYSLIAVLVRAIDSAETKEAAYNKAVADLYSAYTGAGVLTDAGAEAVAEARKNPNITVAQLKAIYRADNWKNVNTGWVTKVNVAVKNAEEKVLDIDNASNYSLIIALAQALYEVVPIFDSSVEEIAAQLVAYVAPEAGEGEGAGDNEDPSVKPGQQGILTTAEGTAAASAGIMAAVATALTAAGVGVVAFRNARRK